MKKKLEADLMSIAHRVLQMKNKSDINQLYVETQKLYEKLSILRFVEEHFGGAKPTIGQAEVVAKMKHFFEENHLSEVKPAMTKTEIVAEEEIIEEKVVGNEVEEDEIAEDEILEETELEFNETEPDEEGEGASEEESSKLEDAAFMPAFEIDVEDDGEESEEPKKVEAIQISFEELLGGDYSDTFFVKAESKKEESSVMDFELTNESVASEDSNEKVISENRESKTVSLNEKQTSGFSIGLNDRIAFVKHLFANSDEDYNRVLNQLITYDSFDEAQNFIEDMVKPDYNNWEGKEDYVQRFLEIIEKKFA